MREERPGPARWESARWEPSARYPDPSVEVLDPRFQKLKLNLAAVERLATGFRWCEGPVWFGDQRCLLWSDIPNNRIMRWDEETGAVSVFRRPSNNANGNTRDRQGRLVTCEHDSRRVTRTEYDGSVSVVCDGYDGKRPNGLCFSPDESRLYVVESGASPRLIHVFDVQGDKLTNKRVFVTCGAGIPDGFRCDTEGNLWCGWGGGGAEDGVVVFDPDGRMVLRIRLPERCANLCFGGL